MVFNVIIIIKQAMRIAIDYVNCWRDYWIVNFMRSYLNHLKVNANFKFNYNKL